MCLQTRLAGAGDPRVLAGQAHPPGQGPRHVTGGAGNTAILSL